MRSRRCNIETVLALLIIVLFANDRCWALTILETSCAPYRADLEIALGDGRAMAHAAYERLVAATRGTDEKADAFFKVLYGADRSPLDVIGTRPRLETLVKPETPW